MLQLAVFLWLVSASFSVAFVLPGVNRITSSRLSMASSVAANHGKQASQTPLDANSIGWFNALKALPGAEVLDVKEWKDEEGRPNDGFMGKDFIHSKTASARIIDYVKLPPKHTDPSGLTEDNFPKLVGPAHFSYRSESHRGKCHGGSFCALMDDAMGWMGFCVTGDVKPWSGYTVQVNTALKKPVPVDSVLKMEAWVHRREGARKYWISAKLSDPADEECVYAEGEGLFLMNPEAV
jgi:acyl-coenzyme A thioesterase PaaI-like protein